MNFTKQELIDLVKSWILISLVFAIASRETGNFLYLVGLSAFGVGVAFIVHELSHKFTAQKYGIKAHFKSFDNLLLFSVLLSVFNLIFLAPGAIVMEKVDKIRAGRIALAGPVSNIILALLFLFVGLIYDSALITFSVKINALLAAFNMLPFFILDGKRIWDWNRNVFWSTFVLALVLVFVSN